MTLQAALIGCGKIGSEFSDDARVKGVYSHAGAYDVVDGVRLAGVCDADSARAEKCARRWGLASSYTDVQRLLDEVRPDIVSICSPDATHAAILRQVLATPSVRGVLAEKPLALDADEAAELVELAERRGVKLSVNYIRRFASGHQRVQEAIAAGAIGQIQSVSGLYSGGLVHNGSHWFDFVRWCIGEIDTVQSFADGVPESGDDPSADVRLTFASGARGFLHGCRRDAFSIFEADIVGTTGRIRLLDSGHRILIQQAGDSPHYSGYRCLLDWVEEEGGLGGAMLGAVADLVDCVIHDRQPRCTGEDGVAALRAARGARESLRVGRAIYPGRAR